MTTRGRSSDADPKKLTTGQRLSKLIADRGVTAKWLAGRVQIQESTLANFRKGFRRIPPDVVAGMARDLDTNVDFLLERSEDARPESTQAAEALVAPHIDPDADGGHEPLPRAND
jgi:transcriptional regulator with XRE-family HTH domain